MNSVLSRISNLDHIRAYQIFSLSRKGALLLLGIALTKMNWALSEIGIWEGLLFSSTLLASFALEALFKVYLSQTGDEKSARNSFKWLFKSCLLYVLAVNVIWALGKPVLEFLLLPPIEWSWLAPFLLFNFVWLPTLALPIYFLSCKNSKGLILLAAYYLLGFPLAFVVSDAFFQLPEHAILGLIIWAFPLFGLALRLFFSLPPNQMAGKGVMKRWLSLSFYGVLASGAIMFDSWLVQWWFPDPSVFAIFRYGAREFPLVSTLAVALSSAMIPTLLADRELGLSQLRTRTRRIAVFLYPISLILIVVAEPLFIWVFSEEFAPAAPIFSAYLLLIMSQLILTNAIILARHRDSWLSRAALFELALNVIFSFLFVKYWGLQGIAWATVIAFLAEKILLAYWLRKYERISIWSYYPKELLLGSLILLITYVYLYL